MDYVRKLAMATPLYSVYSGWLAYITGRCRAEFGKCVLKTPILPHTSLR
jgi:hypothetical protein